MHRTPGRHAPSRCTITQSPSYERPEDHNSCNLQDQVAGARLQTTTLTPTCMESGMKNKIHGSFIPLVQTALGPVGRGHAGQGVQQHCATHKPTLSQVCPVLTQPRHVGSGSLERVSQCLQRECKEGLAYFTVCGLHSLLLVECGHTGQHLALQQLQGGAT